LESALKRTVRFLPEGRGWDHNFDREEVGPGWNIRMCGQSTPILPLSNELVRFCHETHKATPDAILALFSGSAPLAPAERGGEGAGHAAAIPEPSLKSLASCGKTSTFFHSVVIPRTP